jgi:DNA polymerase elongation subunit (family B)
VKILAWDIENRPGSAYIWDLWPNFIPITQVIQPSDMMCFAARWVDKKPVIFKSEYHDGRETMLKTLWDLIDEADALISWNGAGFDTKHANRAFLQAGMTPPSPVKEIDLMQVAKRRFKFMSNKLDYVLRELGLEGKVSHEGFGPWLRCMEGDPKAWALMRRYNKQDVNALIPVYEAFLPWIKNHPNVNTEGIACSRCNSSNLQLRGTEKTQALVYQRFQCQDCGGWGKFPRKIGNLGDTRPL